MSAPHAHFWSVIDKAQRSAGVLRSLLEAMSREEMIDLWREDHELSSELLQPPWVAQRTDFQEELTWWGVAQGKAFYEDVHAHPDRFPKEQGPQGRRFTGTIAAVYPSASMKRSWKRTRATTEQVQVASSIRGAHAWLHPVFSPAERCTRRGAALTSSSSAGG